MNPKPDIALVSLDDIIGLRDERRRNRHAERFGCLQIDHELKFGGLYDRQIRRFCTFEKPPGVDTDLMRKLAVRSVPVKLTNRS